MAFPKGAGVPNEYSYTMGSFIDHKLHALFSRIKGKQAYFSKVATRGLLKYMDAIQPDIVHLHNLHSNYIHLNILLNYLAEKSIKTIVTMHDCWYFTGGCTHYTAIGCDKWKYGCGGCVQRKGYNALLGDVTKEILRDRVKYLSAVPNITFVGCSEWIANEMKQSMLKEVGFIAYIPNGFDLNIFYPREMSTNEAKKEALGLVGQQVILAPAGKWLLPINKITFDYFTQHLPENTKLLLFGCNQQIENVPNNVQLHGFIKSRDEMADLYSIADVMVNCSREDTLSSLNLEAQACGTPVVTYDATGSKETVDGTCGFAIPTGDYKALFRQTLDVCRLGKEAFWDGAVKWITENFEKTVNYNKYIQLYKDVYTQKL